jgi:very-short-patch-repair endonuclease
MVKITKDKENTIRKKKGATVNKKPKPPTKRAENLLTGDYVRYKLLEFSKQCDILYAEEHTFDKTKDNGTAIKNRQYRLDYAFPDIKVGIETDGGIHTRGMGHSTGEGIKRDMEKNNLAIINGWVVFRFSYCHTKEYFDKLIEQVLRFKNVYKEPLKEVIN